MSDTNAIELENLGLPQPWVEPEGGPDNADRWNGHFAQEFTPAKEGMSIGVLYGAEKVHPRTEILSGSGRPKETAPARGSG